MRVHGDVCRGALILSQQEAQSSFLQASLDHVDAPPNEKQSGQVHGVQKQMLESFNANSDEAQNVLPKKASGLWRIAGSKGIDVRRHVQFETKEEQEERRSRQSRTTSRNPRTLASTLTTYQFFCSEKDERAVLRHRFEVGKTGKRLVRRPLCSRRSCFHASRRHALFVESWVTEKRRFVCVCLCVSKVQNNPCTCYGNKGPTM